MRPAYSWKSALNDCFVLPRFLHAIVATSTVSIQLCYYLKGKCTFRSLFKLGLKHMAPQESGQFEDSFMSMEPEGSMIDDFSDVRAIRRNGWLICQTVQLLKKVNITNVGFLHVWKIISKCCSPIILCIFKNLTFLLFLSFFFKYSYAPGFHLSLWRLLLSSSESSPSGLWVRSCGWLRKN